MIAPDLARLLQDPQRVAEIPTEAIPGLLGELERLKALLWAKLMADQFNGKEQLETQIEGDRLLTIPEVAVLLSVPKGYAYELAKRGEIPTVRFGKYVRVPSASLQGWITRHQQKQVDSDMYTVYSSSRGQRDRRGTPANPKTARANPGNPGGAPGRYSHHRRPLGAKRGPDPGADGPANPALGESSAKA